MRWRPHTELPAEQDGPAIVAVRPARGGAPFVLAELYRFDAEDGHWYGVSSVLRIRHASFHWIPARELLPTLPQ